ncbi:MAG: Holliday junction resolvase RuvX [Balneolaceae bacterium]
MHNYARIIGIDVGTKRIGLAQTDLLKTIASPVGTFSPDDVLPKIKQIVKEYPVERFIIGWPLATDGTEGKATRMVSRFIAKLSKEFPSIPIEKIDERYTSNKAKEIMLEIGIPKKKRREKERVDKIAAAIILQHYLDAIN